MTQERLNLYIQHYLDNDQTQSAIMLTGAWGSGKSYYIKNNLIPYLNKNNKDCVVVSLYGITDLKDISKAIYMELCSIRWIKATEKIKAAKIAQKAITWFKTNEKPQAAKIIGKTLLKNISQLVPIMNIDLKANINDLESLYESVDLTEKLIIFEDIERSHIDIIEFLGYVNNFVEQDNVKVLMVANERQILNKGVPIDFSTYEEKFLFIHEQNTRKALELPNEKVDEATPTEKAKEYLLIKEKTISDTIAFDSDYKAVIKPILENFNYLNFISGDDFNQIEILLKEGNYNLRSFIFACQKTNNIFEIYDKFELNAKKDMFYSIISFSFKFKQHNKKEWDGTAERSITLGTSQYPLYKPCYDYIVYQNIEKEELKKVIDYRNEFLLFNENTYDSDFQTIDSFYNHTEKDLTTAIKNIEIKLKEKTISYRLYGEIAYNLIQLNKILEFNIEKIEEYLVSNLRGLKNKIDESLLFESDYFRDKPLDDKYIYLKDKMIKSMEYRDLNDFFGFDYKPEFVIKACDYALINRNTYSYSKSFIYMINIDKLIELIFKCTPDLLIKIRKLFKTIYDNTNIKINYPNDIEKLNELHSKLKIELEEQADAIMRYNLKLFIEDLNKFLNKK